LIYYEFIKICGFGQFGTVRQARKKQIASSPGKSRSSYERKYAIKSIPKKKIKKFDMLRKEITALKMADHPNIVRLYEVFEDSKYIHLVMDFC